MFISSVSNVLCCLGIAGICPSWEEVEAELDWDVYRGLWRDAVRS